MMARDPIIQFDTRAWITDPQLRMTSASTRGIWMDLLCFMRAAPQRGVIKGTIDQIVGLVGATTDDILLFINEARLTNFCDVTICHDDVTQDVTPESRLRHAIVTIENRRMVREEKAKENARLRQKMRREKQSCHTDVTLSTEEEGVNTDKQQEEKKEKKKIFFCWDRHEFVDVTQEHLEQWAKAYPAIDVRTQILRAAAWQKANPKNRKKDCERFLNGWLSRAQDKAPRVQGQDQPGPPARRKPKDRCDKCDQPCDDTVLIRGMKVCLACFRSMDPAEDRQALQRLGMSPGGTGCQKPH